jgi:predicted tellurium resistance membrane protein TerC
MNQFFKALKVFGALVISVAILAALAFWLPEFPEKGYYISMIGILCGVGVGMVASVEYL